MIENSCCDFNKLREAFLWCLGRLYIYSPSSNYVAAAAQCKNHANTGLEIQLMFVSNICGMDVGNLGQINIWKRPGYFKSNFKLSSIDVPVSIICLRFFLTRVKTDVVFCCYHESQCFVYTEMFYCLPGLYSFYICPGSSNHFRGYSTVLKLLTCIGMLVFFCIALLPVWAIEWFNCMNVVSA